MKPFNVVIETPKGSAQKYGYDPNSRFFRMKKILPSGMVFPYDFGFIPDTKGDDGDPLDVIVVSEFSSFPGVLIKCRIIGGIRGEQSESKKAKAKVRNDRFLAVPSCSSIFEKVNSIDDLPKEIIKELEEFFVDYNKLEGRKFKAVSRMSVKESLKQIKRE